MYNFSVNLYTNCEPVTWRPCNCQSEHVLNIMLNPRLQMICEIQIGVQRFGIHNSNVLSLGKM